MSAPIRCKSVRLEQGNRYGLTRVDLFVVDCVSPPSTHRLGTTSTHYSARLELITSANDELTRADLDVQVQMRRTFLTRDGLQRRRNGAKGLRVVAELSEVLD